MDRHGDERSTDTRHQTSDTRCERRQVGASASRVRTAKLRSSVRSRISGCDRFGHVEVWERCGSRLLERQGILDTLRRPHTGFWWRWRGGEGGGGDWRGEVQVCASVHYKGRSRDSRHSRYDRAVVVAALRWLGTPAQSVFRAQRRGASLTPLPFPSYLPSSHPQCSHARPIHSYMATWYFWAITTSSPASTLQPHPSRP